MLNIDLYNPDFIINCKYLRESSQVYELLRTKNISRAFVYGMIWNPEPKVNNFIKIGRSAPTLGSLRKHQVGERIVRQLAWVPGWEGEHVKSSHGSEFWHNINEFAIPKKQLPSNFDKNMLRVAIWDISARTPSADILSDDEEFTASCWAEGELANQYKNFNQNKLPILNFVDPSQDKIYKNPRISKRHFEQLFDYA